MSKQTEIELDDFEVEASDLVSEPTVDVDFQDVPQETVEEPEKSVVTQQPKSVGIIDFDFGSLNIPGVVTGDIGLEVSRFPVERARFTTSNKSLIAIVSNKVIAIKTHFSEELGSYLCFSGKCCEKDGLPRVKYLFPIVVYDTDKSGRPVSKSLEFKALSIGQDQYEDIKTINDLQGDVTGVDLLVSCKDEQYQKISLQPAGDCRWKKDPRLIKEVSTFWAKNMKDIVQSTARRVSEKDFLAKSGYDQGPADNDVNFGDIFE